MTPAVQVPIEKWTGKIREITIGATSADGGTRTKTLTVGGENTLPFLNFPCRRPGDPGPLSQRLVTAAQGVLG